MYSSGGSIRCQVCTVYVPAKGVTGCCMGDKIGALAVSYHSGSHREAYQHKPLPSTGRGTYRGGLSDCWNWISVPTGKGFHIGSLLFGRRYWGGTAKGVASISPLRGQGVTLSVLVRSVLRVPWWNSATIGLGARADLRSCWGWYYDMKEREHLF